MAITAGMVKELREMTGAGMMDCKKALSETNGDMDAAVEFLRKNGQAKAEKKAGRIVLPAFLVMRFYRVMTLSAMCIRSLMSYMLETVPIFCLPSRSKNFKQVPQTRISEPFACRVCRCSTT